MFVEAVLKSSFGFHYVLFVTAIASYHVNKVFRVTVNVMMNRSCLARRIKCIASEPEPRGWLPTKIGANY